ncbi:hypothetical protein X777_06095 [Ooceraea biroi]|uniref:Uncharacterized protein n=1 Tax=Ooceraea biroi TaxID=2015173 RepID=A0A026WDS5_OOCBI|nr:hypothetical protein X777_06095 [Ooceraea biroi]
MASTTCVLDYARPACMPAASDGTETDNNSIDTSEFPADAVQYQAFLEYYCVCG